MRGGVKTGSSFLNWTAQSCFDWRDKPAGPLPSLGSGGIRLQFLYQSARGGQFPPHSRGWPLHDRVTAPLLSLGRYHCRPGLCVGRRHGLKLLARSRRDSGNFSPAVVCTP